MKKNLFVLLGLIISLVIGLPLINIIPDTMNAAEDDEPLGEPIVDFVFGADYNFLLYTYAVGNEGHLFVNYSAMSAGGRLDDFVVIKDRTTGGKPLTNVTKVAVSPLPTAPYNHSVMALRDDETLYMWGDNSKGQFGNGTTSETYVETPVILNPNIPGKIVDIAINYHACYLLNDRGELYASGTGAALGSGSTEPSYVFIKVNENVKKISAVGLSAYALKNDGTVYTWGDKVYDGKEEKDNIKEPIPLYDENGTIFDNVVDISTEGVATNYAVGYVGYARPAVSLLTIEDNMAIGYVSGFVSQGIPGPMVKAGLSIPVTNASDVKGVSATYMDDNFVGFIANDKFYTALDNPFSTPATKVVKARKLNWYSCILSETGALYFQGYYGEGKANFDIGLSIKAMKSDNQIYRSEDKYNDAVDLEVKSKFAITCQVEDPVGSSTEPCSDFNNNEIHLSANGDRTYKKYIFQDVIDTADIIVDLYQGNPVLQNYSANKLNKIKTKDVISLSVPSDQSDWNSYTATITDATGNTSDFTGGTLDEGKYTMIVSDAYGNTQDFQFEVTDKPEPSAVFTPSSTNFVYKDAFTKVNGTVGTVSLQYPEGEPTSTISSIQLGTSSDDGKFSVDTSGAIKVKGSNLNVGTYNITVSGKDGNQMNFSKAITIVVGKANQDNYQITNNANYPFHANQEIAITTSGNDSGENETYTITGGNSVAQIAGSNKFKILTSGTFTLEATVAGNTNYNPKTVSKTITISELPMQNPAIKISSSDSMMYGDTYTPTSSGGQGSGSVTWSIENDNGSGAVLSNGTVKVSGVGSFTLKVTKAGDSSVQSSSDTKVITVNRRRTTVKPKNVTKLTGEVFKDNGVTYNPQPISGDNLGTPIITSKYPIDQGVGYYNDGIQVNGLSHPNYEFIYEEGTLIINSNSLPNNGNGYYKVEGTKGKNNWYVSDVRISTTGKDGYDQISADGISFQTQPLTYHSDGDYSVEFYLKNSATGIIAKAIRYQLKIDQTSPTVPTLTMKEINTSAFATFINSLSFGNWMKQGAEVTMLSSDETSGIDNYVYSETSKGGTTNKTSLSGIVTYQNDVELTIKAKACDKAGNCSEESNDEALMIDRKAPTISGVKDQSVYKYYYLPRYVTITDQGSGLSYGEYTRDGVVAGTFQADVSERIEGVGTYTIKAIDNAGNEGTLTFQIVPLPDIDDIDGSDESKEIIDQVIKELEEIKDKIDETEKKDIEDWIRDALEKWNACRKKIVYTDDKSAKVEGQGDTSFDPKVELIVNEISENDVPKLPKKALVIYDVYLRKGTTKIQPDGSIKVYLPYTQELASLGEAMGGVSAEPIVYQIDTNNKVTQINVQREGDFVTFITDKLVKYAISNEDQEDNNPDKNQCPLDGIEINIDSDGDGKPDVNIDIDGDCKADLNIDTDGDGQPDVDIDTDLDGKPDYNIDVDHDGKPDVNVGPINEPFKPTVCKTVNGVYYCSDSYRKPYLNIDSDGDGRPDINVDLDKDMEADINIDVDGDLIPDLDIDSDGDGIPCNDEN